MEYRSLGRTGISVSALGFGCGAVGGLFVRGEPAEQIVAVERALAAGINYFDTAASYGAGRSEQNLGRVLRELHVDPVIGTKVRLQPDEVSDAPTQLRRKLQAGLARLGRERVDICTLHGHVGAGGETPSARDVAGPIAEGMAQLVEDELASAVGFTALGETQAVIEVLESRTFQTAQCYFNVLNPTASFNCVTDASTQDFDGLINRAAALGHGVLAIRVLAGGALAENPTPHPNAASAETAIAGGAGSRADRARAAILAPIAKEIGCADLIEVGIRFALANDAISTTLVGISDLDQLDQAIAYAERGRLEASAVRVILAAQRAAPSSP